MQKSRIAWALLVTFIAATGISTGRAEAACTIPPLPVPCTGPAVIVAKHKRSVLPSGTYGTVQVKKRGSLLLTGDTYVFCGTLQVARNGSLLASVPASIEVAGNAMFGNVTVVGPVPEDPIAPCDLHLIVAGDVVSIQRNADVRLELCAPNAALHVNTGATLVGDFVAHDSHIHRARVEPCPVTPTTTLGSTSTTTASSPTTTVSSTSTTSTSTTSTTTTTTTNTPTTTSTSSTSTSPTSTTTSTATTLISTTSTESTTSSTTTSSTTTTMPASCGNAVIEPGETCDDGNTTDESTVDSLPPDLCPANCRIETCISSAGSLSVNVNFASAASVAGYKIFVDYPEARVTIPGVGLPPAGVITNDPTQSATANDLDYGLIVVAGGLNAIPPPRLFTINFTTCVGTPPTAADFHCKVHQASDPNGNDIPMTCSVSIP